LGSVDDTQAVSLAGS